MEFVSVGGEALTGYKAVDLVGNGARPFTSLIHADDRDLIWPAVQQAISDRAPFRLTYRILAADGREKWVLDQGVGTWSGTELQALEGFITDITDHKAAEAKRRAQSERFQRIIENTDGGYFRIGMDGRYEDVNPAWLRMHGFTRREDAIGQHFSKVQVPSDEARAEAIVEVLMRGDSVRSGEFSRVRQDGTIGYHTFSANPILDGDRVIGIEGFLMDISERKIADQERRQSEQRYRSLFDSVHEGLALQKLVRSNGIPENYILLEVNRRYEELVGLSREFLVNKLATDVYGTPEAPYLKEYASVIQTGSPSQFETYFAPMDKHLIVSVAPMEGDVFAAIFFDITDQRRTEARYRLIAENAADVIWLWDVEEDRPIYLSPSVTRLRGFSVEEVMAHPLDRAMPPEIYQMIATETRERIAAVEAGDETARIRANEVEYTRKDGSLVAAERVTTLISDQHGKVRHILGVSRDISERKRMEDALRRSEEKFSRAFQTSPAAITIADLTTGSYLEVNGTFEQMTGYRRDEVVGRSWDELRLWTDSSNRDEAVRHLLKDGSLRNWDFSYRKKNGDVGAGLLSADLIEIDGNQCTITATIDITERLELEKQLLQSQKLESIGRLAGGVAHDFNNLLTVILGYGELLLGQIGPANPLRLSVEEVIRAGERAASLTKQLLAFSRKQEIEPRPLDLNTVVKETERMLQRLIGENIEFCTTLDPLLEQIVADSEQVHQIMMNLVVNARDAMPDGGRLEIRTMNVDVGEHEAAIHPAAIPGRYVLMTVTDTGSGMDEVTRQHIFEPFFTTKEVGKGTGLGLSMVYGIMRQSGGWIEVSSDLGVGTSFKLYFPRIEGASVAEQIEAAGAKRPYGGETILVVEDQNAVRHVARTILAMYGYNILEAANGDEALRTAAGHPGEIHLLLTDVVLPGINGKQLSERLKALRPALKVLFISGYTSDVIAHHGVLEPGVALLHKPFSQGELAARVRDILATL